MTAKGDRHEPIGSIATLSETTDQANPTATGLVYGHDTDRDGLWRARPCSQGPSTMMSGYSGNRQNHASKPRIYRIVVKAGGWSIALGEVCTFPFKDLAQAQRIARNLQQQADALSNQALRDDKRSPRLNRS